MNASPTAFIDNQRQTYQTLDKCHDGEGPLMLKDVSVWSGGPRDRINPDALPQLAVRK